VRWTPGGESQNIEDERGSSGGGGMIGGRGLGLGGFLILLVLSLVFRQDFFSLLGGGGGGAPVGDPGTGAPTVPVKSTPEEDREVQFVSFVLDDAQHAWSQILPQDGTPYRDAKLVLFRGAIQSGCGFAQAAMGPFYCPVDHKVYLDLGFFQELEQRFGAPGEFAQAYVVTHELGHHVQSLLGTDARVRRLQDSHPEAANELSVELELQADCFAGVWAHSTDQRQLLEKGDVESALGAAAAVGDDRIQKAQTGGVHPESFTHGTSAQRVAWFRRGFESGRTDACDTFGRAAP